MNIKFSQLCWPFDENSNRKLVSILLQKIFSDKFHSIFHCWLTFGSWFVGFKGNSFIARGNLGVDLSSLKFQQSINVGWKVFVVEIFVSFQFLLSWKIDLVLVSFSLRKIILFFVILNNFLQFSFNNSCLTSIETATAEGKREKERRGSDV